MVDIAVDLGFFKLKNPVLAASGTFGYGLEFTPFLDLNKLGGFVVKGLYFSPREGNPPPRLVETSCGLINAIGLQGIGVKSFIKDILPRLRQYETALIVNICGENDEEYARVAEFLDKEKGISFYELNISCPNIKKDGRCPSQDPELTFQVVKRVKQATARPVMTKLSPNVTDIVAIARAAEEAGSDAISLINTFLAMAIDPHSRKPRLNNVMGGLSGPAIKPIALRMVYQVARSVKIPVVGMGGICSGEDAVEFLVAGARAIQVGTANFISPGIILRIIKELKTFCKKEKMGNIKELIGSLKV
ncbi:MAG: dihydroorotate dehydrogenase [Acidobacteriota bacterium]